MPSVWQVYALGVDSWEAVFSTQKRAKDFARALRESGEYLFQRTTVEHVDYDAKSGLEIDATFKCSGIPRDVREFISAVLNQQHSGRAWWKGFGNAAKTKAISPKRKKSPRKKARLRPHQKTTLARMVQQRTLAQYPQSTVSTAPVMRGLQEREPRHISYRGGP